MQKGYLPPSTFINVSKNKVCLQVMYFRCSTNDTEISLRLFIQSRYKDKQHHKIKSNAHTDKKLRNDMKEITRRKEANSFFIRKVFKALEQIWSWCHHTRINFYRKIFIFVTNWLVNLSWSLWCDGCGFVCNWTVWQKNMSFLTNYFVISFFFLRYLSIMTSMLNRFIYVNKFNRKFWSSILPSLQTLVYYCICQVSNVKNVPIQTQMMMIVIKNRICSNEKKVKFSKCNRIRSVRTTYGIFLLFWL